MIRSKSSKDRIRENTPVESNINIDVQLSKSVEEYSQKDELAINNRIQKLDKEWDIERVLQANASLLGLTGIALGMFKNKKWFRLTGVVLAFLMQHSIQGWCPPLPLFRAMGIRTRKEIEQEKYALKSLRGDFSGLNKSQIDKTTEAVKL